MFRNHVYQEAAAAPEDGGSGGGAAGVIDAGTAGADDQAAAGGDALPEWMGEMAPELAAVAREAKWETPSDTVQSYSQLLALKGAPADRLVKLPGSPESDESKAMLAQMAGVPGEASEYDLDAVQIPEGVDDMRDTLRDALHAAKVPLDAAPGLVQSISEAMAAQKTAAEEETDAKFATAKAAINDKHGGEAPQYWGQAAKGIEMFGFEEGVVDEIALAVSRRHGEGSVEPFFDALALAGRRMGEPTDHGKQDGAGGGGYVSQAQAEARLDEIVSDPTKNPNDPTVRKEMDRLAQIARPGPVRL